MVQNAQEARRRAEQAGAIQRLLKELIPAALIAACDRGESSVRIAVEPVKLKPGAGKLGRMRSSAISDALDEVGQGLLATVVRKLLALGFDVSTAVNVEMQADADAVVDKARSITLDHLMLDYAAAAELSAGARNPLLEGVQLPPAVSWRARAQAVQAFRKFEQSALTLIEMASSRGERACHIRWRDLDKGPFRREAMDRIAESLRGRGFRIEVMEAGTALRALW
jgi:hypothetical protein